MTSPLIKLIGKDLKKALPKAGATEAATLIRVTPGTRTAGSLSAGTNPTTTSVPCLGYIVTERREKVGDTRVEARDRIVALLGESLGGERPRTRDRITIDGATMPVVDTEGSPALWICLCRGA